MNSERWKCKLAVKKIQSKQTQTRGKITSMDDLLKKFGEEIKVYSKGQRIKGIVTEKHPNKLVLDIGGKSEGVVSEKAFDEAKKYVKTLKIGDEIEGSVLIPETPDGFTILSLRRASQSAAWNKLEKAKKSSKPIGITIKNSTSAGLIIDIDGLTGFIPSSLLTSETSKNASRLAGKSIMAKVVDLSREENKIVLSEKGVVEGEGVINTREAIEKLKEGEAFEGKVITVANFGCFVRIQVKSGKNLIPVEGLVHVSELTWSRVENPSDVVKEGQIVKVKVINKRDGKLSLSMKQAAKDPWDGSEKKYKPESKHKGKVVRRSDFGTFIELEPGVEGLIHMTKIPPGTRLEIGTATDVIVEEVNEKDRKLSLGIVLTSKPIGYK